MQANANALSRRERETVREGECVHAELQEHDTTALQNQSCGDPQRETLAFVEDAMALTKLSCERMSSFFTLCVGLHSPRVRARAQEC